MVGPKLVGELKKQLIALLNKYNDVLIGLTDMQGINTNIVVHWLPLQLGYRSAE